MFQLLFALLAFILVGLKLYFEFSRDILGPARRIPRIRPQDHEINEHLKQIAFYNELSINDKQQFLDRVQYFLENKDFQGMQGQLITNEVRAIVAASAVQVGFRIPQWKFPSYKSFRISRVILQCHLQKVSQRWRGSHRSNLVFTPRLPRWL